MEVQNEGSIIMQGFVVVGIMWYRQTRESRCINLESHAFKNNHTHTHTNIYIYDGSQTGVYIITLMMKPKWMYCGRKLLKNMFE